MKIISFFIILLISNIFAGIVYNDSTSIETSLTGIFSKENVIDGNNYASNDFSIQWRISNIGGGLWSYSYIIQTLSPHLDGVFMGTKYNNDQLFLSHNNLPIDLYGNKYLNNTISFISELDPGWGHFYIYQGDDNYIYNRGLVSPGARIPVPVPEPLAGILLILGAIVARPVDKKKRIKEIKEIKA